MAPKNSEYRNYKIERIISATLLNETFIYPSQFQLQSYWEDSKKSFVRELPKFNIEALVSPHIIKRLTFTSKFVDIVQIHQNHHNTDWSLITLSFNSEQEALEYIVGFGKEIKITSPQTLKQKVVIRAKEIVEMYSQ